MEMAYVSVKEFKKLEKKVNSMITARKPASKLTAKERKLVREAKSDIKKKQGFSSVKEL